VSITLRLRTAPGLRLDLRGVLPTLLAGLDAAAIEKLPLGLGRGTVPLAEFFDVQRQGDEARLVLQGDLSRCDRIGWQMAGGGLLVEGAVGDWLAAGMTEGLVQVHGSARDLAGCEMAGGELQVDGDVGDFAASAQPGSMDGMRGGVFTVRGSAGQRFADRMRRGTVFVHGDAGDYFASRLVAGTIAIAGHIGAHPGYGMRRGSLVFVGPAPALPDTTVPAIVGTPVIWQLLARSLQRQGGAFSGLALRAVRRHLGDLAVGGRGEWLLAN
jgi:formylmethanofuran dehydrogenase subunit C